jgi:hypothetical protein
VSQLLTERWDSGPRAEAPSRSALMVNGRESSGSKFVTRRLDHPEQSNNSQRFEEPLLGLYCKANCKIL